MPFKTDLNVTPYYDDYSSSDNFQQVLARPAFAIQARELTQLQSILRNHSEKIGDFVFLTNHIFGGCLKYKLTKRSCQNLYKLLSQKNIYSSLKMIEIW